MTDQSKLDALFLKARTAPHTSVFNETKECFLIASSEKIAKTASRKGHFITFNKGIIMLVIAGLISLTCFLMLGDGDDNKTQSNVELKQESKKENNQVKEKNVMFKEIKGSVDSSHRNKVNSLKPNTALMPISNLINRSIKYSEQFNGEKNSGISSKPSGDFIFPKLTEEEISENNRRKKKMVKALNKRDDKVYAYIPSGSFSHDSKIVSVAAFHIQRTEVTNLEYKTFLFDLLIQDRKADFLLAKPKQELWTQDMGEEYRYLQDEYFSGDAYEDYPVNNISRKGAEMYCVWITQEANKLNLKNGKALINDVRIPMRAEWVKAATIEGKFPEYSWSDTLSPISLQCNFNMKGLKCPEFGKVRKKDVLTISDSSVITSGECLSGELLSKSKSYKPNEYGLFNMNGNLAEMVYEQQGSGDLVTRSQLKPGTAGGGWMNTSEEIKFTAEDLYQGVEDEHLNIGFRVVISYLHKP